MFTQSVRAPGLVLSVLLAAAGSGLAPAARAELFVVDASENAVHMYDQDTGVFLGNFIDNTGIELARQLTFPRSGAFTADGSYFVSGFDNFALLRYTGLGGNLGVFANATTTGPGFGQPAGVAIHGGLVYVADPTLNNVKRYDPTKSGSDAFLGVFATDGVNNPEGIAFDSQGRLYVANVGGPNITRYNGTTGALIDTLDNGSSGLQSPRDLTFGPDGKLYVADEGLAGKIPRYNVGTGAFQDFFVDNDPNLASARTLVFGPDDKLYVGDTGNSTIWRYTAAGAQDGVFVGAGSGGLSAPADLVFATPGGTKLIVSFHWWGILALTCLFGAMHLAGRRKLARLQALRAADPRGISRRL